MKAVALLAIFLFAACVSAYTNDEYSTAFTSWVKEHNKMYAADEFLARFNIFKSNMDYVRDWNAAGSSTVLGLNIMADLSNSEYRNIYLGTRIDASNVVAQEFVPTEPTADVVDWRTKGAVTGIKDQGQCGSCWSFSATGSTEAASFQKTGKLVSLSEQNLMDCSTAYGNQGCNGGLMDSAFKYIIANKGIDTEASYPYTAKSGTCHYTAANSGASITNYKDVAAKSESALQTAVNMAPVSVAIDASHNSFQLYKSGVYYESACSSSNLDHGVLAIGYGTDASNVDYWLVKNSWGLSWGTQGYINMSRNKNNNCGIATSASYPLA
jgi:cathepsin L